MSGTWDAFNVTPTWQEFIADQEKEEYALIPEQLAAFKILFSEPTIPASEVAQQVAAPLLAQVKGPDDLPNESVLWRTVAYGIMQLTEFNDRLFDFVVAFQKIKSTNFSFNEMVGFRQHWTEFVSGCTYECHFCCFH
jgi:hypothetical protein